MHRPPERFRLEEVRHLFLRHGERLAVCRILLEPAVVAAGRCRRAEGGWRAKGQVGWWIGGPACPAIYRVACGVEPSVVTCAVGMACPAPGASHPTVALLQLSPPCNGLFPSWGSHADFMHVRCMKEHYKNPRIRRRPTGPAARRTPHRTPARRRDRKPTAGQLHTPFRVGGPAP
jgi:hypothetical protein